MFRRTRTLAAAIFGSAVLATGVGAPLALASNQNQGDALVNVQVGDITVQDINVAVAANIVATACDLIEADVLVLAQQVDATGQKQTFCSTDGGKVRIRQN